MAEKRKSLQQLFRDANARAEKKAAEAAAAAAANSQQTDSRSQK